MNVEKLRFFMRRRGIKLEALSKSTGYSKVHLSAVLHGRKGSSVQFAKLLEMGMRELAPEGVEEELEEMFKESEL